MNKRLLKRHKRQVARAKEKVKVSEPDVRTRIINPGLANLTYYDFPLTQHRNTLAASNAAASELNSVILTTTTDAVGRRCGMKLKMNVK